MLLTFDGIPMSEVGAWSLGEWSTDMRGPEALAWTMRPDRPNPVLRPGQLIELYDGGGCVWSGVALRPARSTGDYKAVGHSSQAYATPALDGSGNVTTVVDTAVAAAVSRGALLWNFDATVDSLSTTAVSTDTLGEVPTIGELLDAVADEAGQWWRVNPNRRPELWSRPTEPRWMVTRGAGALDLADGDYASKLYLRRRTNTGGYATESAADTDAAALNGYAEATVDLTPLGYITQAKAENIGAGILAKGRARLGFANGVDASNWQVMSLGGVPAHMTTVRGGHLARFIAQHDQTRYLQGRGYVDELLGRVVHPAGRAALSTVQLQPNGLELGADYRDLQAYMASSEKHKRRGGGRS